MTRLDPTLSAADTLAEWHEKRSRTVGGSEVAALFGEHAQLSLYELWHLKCGDIPRADLSGVERVAWGNFLEPAIAAGVADLKGWTVRKVRRYIKHPTVDGFGGSLDFEIVKHPKGPGVLEIKNTDFLVARNWEDNEPPLAYLLQLQSYLAITGRAWGAVAVLVGGNDLRVFEYDRRPGVISKIEDAVREFWRSIDEGREPKPDFGRDLATIAALNNRADGEKFLDLTGDNRLPDLCAEYLSAGADAKAANERKDAAKGEMLLKIGDAAKVRCGEFSISAGMIAESEIAYTRKPYRDFRLSMKKPKEKPNAE